MARPSIYDRPMTTAERKQRSRETMLAAVTAELDQAMRECNALLQRLPEGEDAERVGQVMLLIDGALMRLEGRVGGLSAADAIARWRTRD